MAAFDPQRAASALLGGMTPAAFDAEVRERCARHFPTALADGQAEALFDLARLEAVLGGEPAPLAQVDLFQDGHLIRLEDVQRKSGRSGLAVVVERFAQGATVRVRDIDALDAGLGAFAAAARHRLAAPAQVNMYLTPSRQDGFPPHFDITDGFVVQCLGTKQWRVHADYTQRMELPHPDTDWDPARFRPLGEPRSLVLGAGDVLYLPRGVMHEARCTDRASLHLTVSIEPLNWADLARRALARAAHSDVAWRRRVPWSANGAPDEDSRVALLLRERLLALADALEVPALLAAERQALRDAAQPARVPADTALAGRLAQLFGQPQCGAA
jgi:hypothetical protein